MPEISIANVSEFHPINSGGFGIAYIKNTICIIQILALYFKNSNYHSYIKSHTHIDELSYIATQIFLPLHFNLFSCFDNRQGFTIAAHIPSSYLIYYLGNGNFIELDEKVGLLTIKKTHWNNFIILIKKKLKKCYNAF